MIKGGIKGRIILPTVIILTVLVIVMTIDFIHYFTRYTGILYNERVAITANSLKRFLLESKRNSRVAAISSSHNINLIKAIGERDTGKVIKLLDDTLELYAVDYFTVTDENGTVLARTHSPENFGDSLLYRKSVQEALEGGFLTCFEEGTIIKVSACTAVPVYDSAGILIGIIIAGVRLDTNEALDNLKKYFNAEITVFFGDTRIATTIEIDGERITGTQLNPDRAKIILETGEEYLGNSDVLDEDFSAYYMPLKNDRDEIFAALFVGQSNRNLIAERNALIKKGILFCFLGFVISMMVLTHIIVKITQPINRTIHLVSEVTRGNINVDINRSILANDEIGRATLDIYGLIDVVKSMTNDVSQLTHDLNIYGDINYMIDSNKYSGSFRDIINNIKKLADSISMMKKTMAVMDYLDTMISVVNFDYNLLYINRCLSEKYGVDREGCLGQKCYRIIRNLHEPCSACQLPKLLSHSGSSSVANYHDAWDSSAKIWMGGRAATIQWIDGSRVFLNSFYDETEKKNYEIKLSEALKKEEGASIAKSTFLANMSHEIRTPMNSIVGFSELALDGDISPKTNEYLTKILENAKWLLQNINDILDISKIESGNMGLENIPFDLHELIAVCENIISVRAIEKNIDLAFYIEPLIEKKLRGDPTRLRQVLINLLSNAVKFTDTGKVSLSITAGNCSENSVVLRFEVKDNGIGMTGEQIKNIFEPFMQADASTTRKYGGTGLGLTITKNLLDLMGSKLEIESTPGAGSKFSFVAVFDTVDEADETLKSGSIISEIEKPVFNGEVLVCEDNQMNQRVIIEHLARVGLRAEIAENGQEGIDKVKKRIEKAEKPFDLILMDIHMPVMDGIEATSKIVELGLPTPIVAMTANIMKEDRELYQKIGMDGYVGKPFTSQELWRCLLKYLKPLNFLDTEKDGRKKDDKSLFIQLKKDFVKNNQTKFREITEAISSGDTVLAHRLVHTLKSNAGLIGKNMLQKAAFNIEHALKNDYFPVTSAQLDMLKTELSKVLDELKPYLNETKGPLQSETAALIDSAQVFKLLDELEPLLKSGNPECLKMVDSLRAIPGSRELAGQMEDFCFGAAVKTLEELKERFAC